MHFRRLASFVIGAWLAGSVLLDSCVIQNFREVDRFIEAADPIAAQQVGAIGGRTEARSFLRREAGELNASLFERWEISQFVIGIALLGVIVFGAGEAPRVALLLTVAMLTIVAVDRFYLTPEITRLGRLPVDAHFWMLHGVSSGLELVKLALGLVSAGTLLIRHNDRKHFVKQNTRMAHAATPTI